MASSAVERYGDAEAEHRHAGRGMPEALHAGPAGAGAGAAASDEPLDLAELAGEPWVWIPRD